MRTRKAFSAYVLALVLALLTAGCEIEEEIRLNPDGTGLYRAKVMLEKELVAMLPDLRRDYEKKGFRVVEQRETDNRHVIVVEREFKDLSEIGDEKNRYSFTTASANWLQRRYEFHASVPPADAMQGFSRQLTVALPGNVRRNTAGEVRGDTVVWDASKGGSLQVTSAGLAPTASRWLAILLGVAGAVVLLAIGLAVSRRRRSAPALHCATCGAPSESNARFCAKCGAANVAPAVEGSGG
jgi:hypothetical protein